MSIFSMLLSVLVSSQLAIAAAPSTLKNKLPGVLSEQIKQAILSDNTRILESLMSKRNVSVNAIMLIGEQNKSSMLAFAVMNRKTRSVRYLAEQGAELIDVNWHPSGIEYRDTLINFANTSRNKEIANILEGMKVRLSENFPDEKSISAAAASGDIDLIENFLNNFAEIGEDRDKRLLAKTILDGALLVALKRKKLTVVEEILKWRLAATTKEYLDNLPPEMRPLHDEAVIKKAILLAKTLEEGQIYMNLSKTIARIGNLITPPVPPVTSNVLKKKATNDAELKSEIKPSQASQALEELWENLLAIVIRNADKEFSVNKFKEKHKMIGYISSIKNGIITHTYFSRIEKVVEILKSQGADEEELDELLMDFAEFAPVIANPSLMAAKLHEGSTSAIDAAVEYAEGSRGGRSGRLSNLEMIYNGLEHLSNKEYIQHFELLIDAQTLEQIR